MTIEPVRKQIIVAASQVRAFRVFTEGMDRWWPRKHHIGTSPLARQVLEPKLGGRWYAISQDGSECDIGKVLSWEPPHRLVLAWQLDAEWRYDPSFMTEIEVRFGADGPKTTRVDFEHRNLERYGIAAPRIRDGIDSPEGWGGSLDLFGVVVEADENGA
jgi:uncharacterized protein YndB with AHSA1/START domain